MRIDRRLTHKTTGIPALNGRAIGLGLIVSRHFNDKRQSDAENKPKHALIQKFMNARHNRKGDKRQNNGLRGHVVLACPPGAHKDKGCGDCERGKADEPAFREEPNRR